jgi:hypothetical protein
MNNRQAIRNALQRGYGDATQTVLDDRVAGDVLSTLRERGWASLDEVAAIIHAAGGEVRLDDEAMRHIMDQDLEVTVSVDCSAPGMSKVLQTRVKP